MNISKIKNLNLSFTIKLLAFTFLFLAFMGITTAKAYAADTDATYLKFNNNIGSCPRVGNPVRTECVLKVAKIYVDFFCANRQDKSNCNTEWTNGYLVWFSKQPNQQELLNQIGNTALDTSNSACIGAVSELPAECSQPYNTSLCKDKTGARPAYCNLPALSSDGSQTGGQDDPTKNLAEHPPCEGSDKEIANNENNKCQVVMDCKNGDISEGNCKITYYLKMFINILSGLVGLIIVIVLIVAGIQYSTSAGDPQKAGNAKKRIFNAVLALIVYAFMFAFLQWLVPGGIF